MADQAQGLRALADYAHHGDVADFSAIVTARAHPRTIAVTSGKGGVGKTNLSTNLAIQLAHSGERVIVFDADLGLANIHMMLGVSPRLLLTDVLNGSHSVRDILCDACPGVRIISGGSGMDALANLSTAEYQTFARSLREVEDLADVLLVDTGAGLSQNVLAFVLAVDEAIVVTTPDPTAIADAYATIKVIVRERPDEIIHLVVNMAANETEANRVRERLELVTRRFLKAEIDYIGYIPLDNSVRAGVRAQQPFVVGSPHSAAARAVVHICDSLGYVQPKRKGVVSMLDRMAHYMSKRA